jgi:hypothetical protein
MTTSDERIAEPAAAANAGSPSRGVLDVTGPTWLRYSLGGDGERLKDVMNGAIGYDIDTVLAAGEPNKVLSALVTAIESRSSKRLVGREVDIYWPYKVHASILWDGVRGTLFNYGLILLVRAAGGMERIGAVRRAGLLKQAIESFGDQDRVSQLVKRFPVNVITSEQEKLFEELDTKWYELVEIPEKLMVAYMVQHIDEFRSCNTEQPPAQPCAPPNGGPAERFGNSGVGGGPPSVS